MTRPALIALLVLPLVFATAEGSWPTAAVAKDGDSGGGGGGGHGGGDSGGRGGGDDSGGRGGSDNSGRGSGDDKGRGNERGDDGGGHGRGRGGDDGGQGRGRGRGGDDNRAGSHAGWGSTSSDHAREAVSKGWALALSTVLPTVTKAVPGKVLEVDLRQSWSGDWHYEFLVLTQDRRFQEVVVDARRNQILQIRRR